MRKLPNLDANTVYWIKKQHDIVLGSMHKIVVLHYAHRLKYYLKQVHRLEVPKLLEAVNYPKSNACAIKNSSRSVGGQSHKKYAFSCQLPKPLCMRNACYALCSVAGVAKFGCYLNTSLDTIVPLSNAKV